MDYICDYYDVELELDDVESEQEYAGSYSFTNYYTYVCPKCGRVYQNSAIYVFSRLAELTEIK